MTTAVKLGFLFAVVFGLSLGIGPGWWGFAAVMGVVAILQLVHAWMAWKRARLPWFGLALIVSAISAVLLALLLILKQDLAHPWLFGLGAGVLVGFLVSAWLIRRQGRTSPTTWLELEREMERSSVVGLLLGRPLRALGSRSG